MDLRKVALKEIEVIATTLDGELIRMREMGAVDLVAVQSEAAGMDGAAVGSKQAAELSFQLIAKSVIDAKGKRYLDSSEGIEVVRNMPWDVVVELSQAALELNNMTDKKKAN